MKETTARLLGNARFALTLMALARLLQLQAAKHPAYREQLKRRDLTLQLMLLDGSRGRLISLKDGRVRSRRGVFPDADVVMSIRDTAVAARVLRPNADRLEFLNAANNSQMVLQGDDRLVSHAAGAAGAAAGPSGGAAGAGNAPGAAARHARGGAGAEVPA